MIDLQRAHLFDLAKLIAKVRQREAAAAERFLGELFRLFPVDFFFRLLDERKNVAHAENAADDSVGMEGLDGIVFFADAEELDGLPGDLANRQSGAAAGIAVHLGEHDAGERELVVELLGGVDGILAGHGIGDEENFLRIQQPLERLHLVHQLLVDVQAAGGVDDEHVAAAVDGFAARFFRQALDRGGVRLRRPRLHKAGR